MKELRGTGSHPVSAMVSESGVATQATKAGSRAYAAEQSEYMRDEADDFELNLMQCAPHYSSPAQ